MEALCNKAKMHVFLFRRRFECVCCPGLLLHQNAVHESAFLVVLVVAVDGHLSLSALNARAAPPRRSQRLLFSLSDCVASDTAFSS